MRRASPDQKYEALALLDPAASRKMSAAEVKELLGLAFDERTIQRWARQAYGRIPTRRELRRRDPERDALVRQAEADGLDRRYCLMSHLSFHPTLLRRYEDGSLAFVCRRHARRGDS